MASCRMARGRGFPARAAARPRRKRGAQRQRRKDVAEEEAARGPLCGLGVGGRAEALVHDLVAHEQQQCWQHEAEHLEGAHAAGPAQLLRRKPCGEAGEATYRDQGEHKRAEQPQCDQGGADRVSVGHGQDATQRRSEQDEGEADELSVQFWDARGQVHGVAECDRLLRGDCDVGQHDGAAGEDAHVAAVAHLEELRNCHLADPPDAFGQEEVHDRDTQRRTHAVDRRSVRSLQRLVPTRGGLSRAKPSCRWYGKCG